jgi:hemolysin activation/secretion protein
VSIEGNNWFEKGFLSDRIKLSAAPPLNLVPLQERLQLMQQDPRIQSLHAELRPGSRPGESELKVKVEEKPPISVWLAFNNYQSPSVGAERGMVTLAHQNISGHGDPFSVTYAYSDGLNPMLDVWYAVPLNVYDTTLMLRYRRNDTKVVDDIFGPLNIVSKTEGVEISLRQPLYRTLNNEVAMTLAGEYEYNRTWLDGEPFSFSAGVDNGRSIVVPIRLSHDWTYRSQRQVFAARSRISFGTNMLGATTTNQANAPDSQFLAWLGQFQYARIFDLLDSQLLARVDIQRSNSALLPVEQLGMGGRFTVRGYRENHLVRDEGVIASLETRIPLLQNYRWADYLQFCQFIDYGQGKSKLEPNPSSTDMSSIGLGLRWAATPIKLPFEMRVETEAYWGHQLRHVENLHKDLQDDGIHLQFAVTGYF